ncbi:MAG: hypothetical protein ONB46_19525 [candidate division KSB1 bacterium]|nr:hypothetical protein [candidate division KSB1 bacterium]MDZ7368067.1 hypothetical protein [candidate division KSB1 bacterium]MDZ7405707.1 hypothetical protein [candidate division KSB1 bacterium]
MANFAPLLGQINKRLTEATRPGFKQAVIPKLAAKGLIPGIKAAVEKITRIK